MPLANIRGANIHYEVLGARGPWVALSPGGRLGLENLRSLAGKLADKNHRVLLHDRRNCGASDVVIEVMSHWSSYFSADAEKPVIGASEAELRSIRIPALIVPGNDRIHSRFVGENLARLIPGSELHVLMADDLDMDMGPNEEWTAKEIELAALFIDFMNRVQSSPARRVDVA